MWTISFEELTGAGAGWQVGTMKYACTECGSPAVKLPDRLDPHALVHCRDCRKPVATWAVFKHRATQAIVAELKTLGEGVKCLSYDPLDVSLLPALTKCR